MIFRNELNTESSDINNVFIHMIGLCKMCFILNDPNLFRLSVNICYTTLLYIPGNIIVHLNSFIIDCLLFMQCFHVLKSLISFLREAFL